MATVRGGDIKQLTIGGREFDVAAEANVNIDVGGMTNELALNGNGNPHVTQRRKMAGFSDCSLSIDDSRQDMEYIQDIAEAGELVPVTITLASGVVYSGALLPVGDLMKATGDGTLGLEMRGAKFEQV